MFSDAPQPMCVNQHSKISYSVVIHMVGNKMSVSFPVRGFDQKPAQFSLNLPAAGKIQHILWLTQCIVHDRMLIINSKSCIRQEIFLSHRENRHWR